MSVFGLMFMPAGCWSGRGGGDRQRQTQLLNKRVARQPMVFRGTSIHCSLSETPGHTSCTKADGKDSQM